MILVNLLIHVCYSTVVGIDLGSDSIKVAVGSRYKPVHLVRNLYSNEATPNIFSYTDKYHWAFGEGARDQCRINPKSCIQNQRIPLNDKLYFAGNPLKGYQITALSLIQIIHNVNITERIIDEMKVVIAIPPSMTNREKSYLYTALTIAGINCIQFITSTYAPIEVYVNEQKYGSRSDNTAVFIDIGHEGVRVSGFEFDKTKITQKFGLYNDNVGGKTIDNNLLKYVINKYNIKLCNQFYVDKSGYDNDLEYLKNRMKLLSEIRKAREQLTVNTKVTFDYQSKTITLTRKDIDDCSTEVKQTLNQMIQSLKQSNPNLLRSGTLQLLGGCSRIICLQEYIKTLLPTIRQLRILDTISSVCMGACYIVDSEIQTSIQVHDALVTTEVILKTSGNVYKLFSYGNTENFGPVVRLNNVEPLQLFRVIDKNDNEQEFTRFTIKIPSNYNNIYVNTVDLGFSLNYYLMPVPDEPKLIQQYGNQVPLAIDYERIGWEVPPEELTRSKEIINLMLAGSSKRQRIEDFKSSVQKKLSIFGLNDWRYNAFNGLCLYIDSLYNSCYEITGSECTDQKINSILHEFKSLAHFVLNIDVEGNDPNKSERENAIEELYNLIEACKLAGARYTDVENWIKSRLNTATLKELYEQIGTLKERGKKAQQSYFSNL